MPGIANWYEIKNMQELDTPALVVFPERVIANINTAIKMVGDINRLRPHVKTNKSPDACRLMIAAGIHQFKCATIAEAEMLGEIGARDVLLAYQPTGPKLNRFVQLIQKFPKTSFSCLADNNTVAQEQSDVFSGAGLKVPVYVDLNIGMNRTGIAPGKDSIELYAKIASSKGLIAGGLHAYDGHLRSIDIVQRTKECNDGFKQVEGLADTLKSKGLQVPTIIAGGSPTFPIHALRKNVQCSPGTFIYWDKGYTDLCPEQEFLPAAVLVTRIISLPASDRITTDLGHKSVAAENEIGKRVWFLNDTDLKPVGQSEEHLVLEAPSNHKHHTGDVLYGLPFHICPTVALYERLYRIENNQVTGEWKTIARDRKITV